jgi:hypothetical protein
MPKRSEGYPQLWGNVNSPPVLIHQPEQAQALGSAWRRIDLTPFLPQPAPPLPDVPPVTLSPSSASLADVGGPVQFTVTVTGEGQSGTWTVDKDSTADWLTVQSPTEPQTESGEVLADVASNIGGAGRTAHMYINGKTFTVTQAGA